MTAHNIQKKSRPLSEAHIPNHWQKWGPWIHQSLCVTSLYAQKTSTTGASNERSTPKEAPPCLECNAHLPQLQGMQASSEKNSTGGCRNLNSRIKGRKSWTGSLIKVNGTFKNAASLAPKTHLDSTWKISTSPFGKNDLPLCHLGSLNPLTWFTDDWRQLKHSGGQCLCCSTSEKPHGGKEV